VLNDITTAIIVIDSCADRTIGGSVFGCSAVQCSAVQCSAVQFSAVQCSGAAWGQGCDVTEHTTSYRGQTTNYPGALHCTAQWESAGLLASRSIRTNFALETDTCALESDISPL
jgi:hypothetical protein